MASSHFFCPFRPYLGTCSPERVARLFSALNAIPHPVQHHNADCRQYHPHRQELRAHLSHDVPRHSGVIPYAHTEPHIRVSFSRMNTVDEVMDAAHTLASFADVLRSHRTEE